MKRIILILCLLAAGFGLHAQVDSARIVVDSYLKVLNYEQLRSDSMLYIESKIFTAGQPDTILLYRWHADPNMDRMELWLNGKQELGFLSNGKGIDLRYWPNRKRWALMPHESYLDMLMAYDFHSPLYNYGTTGVEMEYMGVIDFQGHPCYRLLVRCPQRYDRYYLFDKSNNLLFFLKELETSMEKLSEDSPRVDWRAVHEYMPFSGSLLVSEESYQNQEGITIMRHKYKYLPIDKTLFNQNVK